MLNAIRPRKIARASKLKMARLVQKEPMRAPFRLLKTVQPFKYLYNRSQFPIRHFKPKFPIRYETESFILKTADSPFELRQVLKLRHDIFYLELQGKETESHLDVDEFDTICDHLIIIDKKSSKVVGTYRLISSLFSDKFYSQGEFTIDELLVAPGSKLELGRACIHPEFRNGTIITLLWRGICAYVKKTDSKYLFGCASVQTTDPLLASQILAYLKEAGLSPSEYNVEPKANYRSELVDATANTDTAEQVPALVQSYIKAGAKFYGKPALDRDFDCYDFFMVLKVEEMSKLFKRRFGLE